MKMFSIAAIALAVTGFVCVAEEPVAKAVPVASEAEQDGAPVGSPVRTSGKVVSMHSLALAGVADPHMIVKIQTEESDVDIVDLGSTAELKANGIEPKEGQQFWIEGRVGKINDKFLIVAEQLSETKMISITHNHGSVVHEEWAKHPAANHSEKIAGSASTNGEAKDRKAPKTATLDAGQQVRTVEGTVIHSRRVMIEGEASEHVLAKIQTENGIAVIDLGTCAAMPNSVDLTEGKMISASGYVGKLNDKPVIFAETVGNLNTIQRPAGSQPVPASNPNAQIK